MVNGFISLMNSNYKKPVNIGNPKEFSVLELAKLISNKLNKNLDFEYKPLPQDDPIQRKPSIELAKKELNWEPKIELDEGIDRTIDYFNKII